MNLSPRSVLLLSLISSMSLAGCGGFEGVVTPTLSSISPASIAAGGAAFTLTATGTNYTAGTLILWDGIAQPTTVVSNTKLTTQVSAAQIAAPRTVSLRVIKPDTTTSGTMQLTITGSVPPAFSLSAISPSAVAAGSASFTLTAQGVGFVTGSVITLNSVGVTTAYDSATQLHATIPASNVAAAGTITVSVSNPDKTASNQLPLTVTGTSAGTPPTLTSLSPSTAYNGSSGITVTANGKGFASGSQIVWDGISMPTTFVSSTVLTASIAATSFASVGVADVFVLNSDSTVSGVLPFTILLSPSTIPTLISISPTKTPVGSGDFTMTLKGTNFAPGTIAFFGNDPLATTVVSETQLTARVPASELTAVAQVPITTENPSSKASNPIPFLVGMTIFFGEVNDLAWDAPRNILYISQPGTSTKNPNTVVAIDPLSLVVKYTYSPGAGAEPNHLALSDDRKYLFVGLDGNGTVERLLLPGLTPDISISLGSDPSLGPYYAMDLQVEPGESNTIAVARGISAKHSIIQAQGGVAIYDGAVQRPLTVTPTTQSGDVLLDTIQWGSDAATLYAANNETYSGDFYQLSVSSSGVTLTGDYVDYFPLDNLRIHFDPTTKLIYGDDGLVVNPAAPVAQAGNFVSMGAMVPDSTTGNAFFIGQPSTDYGSVAYLLQSFNLTTFSPVAQLSFYEVEGVPQHLIRWGYDGLPNGLAFNTKRLVSCVVSPCTTGDGRLYILEGPFVSQTVP
jgi:hypothetical protein